jgi:phenylacetate-CoA ligase
LNWWRYGRDLESLVDQALAREQWSPEQWRVFQETRLAEVLHRAATRVPYYREHWARRRRNGDRAAQDLLANWPILGKQDLRRAPRAFLADDRNPRCMLRERTSGTTGTPLDLWAGRRSVQAWYALVEARWRRWYGVTRTDPWAILGGQRVADPERRQPPFWVWNAPMRQLYLSTYHLSPDLASTYVDALEQHRVRYIYGYTSALHALAAFAPGRLGDLGLAVVITNAEPVTETQRTRIAQAFRCPVRETYGMAETVAAGGECAAGHLHAWPEAGWVEYLEGGERVEPGTVGELVCTGLLNPDMPLIRYQVGDRAVAPVVTEPCSCGRTLPLLGPIDGRNDDLAYTVDGRAVSHLHLVFGADLHVSEGQIVQEALDRVRVRYVPERGFGQPDERALVEGVRARMGPVTVALERVETIPRTGNGKLRTVICELPPDQRRGPAR